MKNKKQTRLRSKDITTHSLDTTVNYAISASFPAILLTVRSATMILEYESEADRDSDMKLLDKVIEGEENSVFK